MIDSFLTQLAATSWQEGVAVVLALFYVWLAAKQNIWCWPSALVSTGIYTWLFWSVSLPFHTALIFYYLLMAVYGWGKWNNRNEQPLQVKTWPLQRHIICILSVACFAWGLSHYASAMLDANYLYLDAFVTVFSVFTTFLVTHKIRENWLYWIVINLFGSYLFFAKDLALTGVLFLCYTGFAVFGYMQWRIQPETGRCNTELT